MYSYDTVATVQPQPEDGIPVDCSETSDGWHIPGLLSVVLTPLPPVLASTFDIFLGQQPEHIAALLPKIQWYCQDAYDFCDQAFHLSHTLLVNDGGAAKNMATFGWIIGTTSGTRLAAGSGPVFGFDPRSYHAETCGFRTGMTLVQLVFQFCRRTMSGTLEVRFDN
jgi:hypothetical protein